MVLSFVGVDAKSLHAEMDGPERSRYVSDFALCADKLQVLILSYKVGGTGLNLDKLCYHTFVFTRPNSKAVEDQAIFPTRRITQTREQFVVKLTIEDSWDDERQVRFEEKALANFYAQSMETKETQEAVDEEERSKRNLLRRVVK